MAVAHVSSVSHGPACLCSLAPTTLPAPTDCHAAIHIPGAPSGPPVCSSCTCCSRQGSCQCPMRQCHLATKSALMPPGCSCSLPWSALASPAGEPFLFPQPRLWEEAWSKAVWGCTVWASMASCPLSRALTRWAQFLSVTPEFSGLDIPSGLLFRQRPNTQRTGLPQAYFAG